MLPESVGMSGNCSPRLQAFPLGAYVVPPSRFGATPRRMCISPGRSPAGSVNVPGSPRLSLSTSSSSHFLLQAPRPVAPSSPLLLPRSPPASARILTDRLNSGSLSQQVSIEKAVEAIVQKSLSPQVQLPAAASEQVEEKLKQSLTDQVQELSTQLMETIGTVEKLTKACDDRFEKMEQDSKASTIRLWAAIDEVQPRVSATAVDDMENKLSQLSIRLEALERPYPQQHLDQLVRASVQDAMNTSVESPRGLSPERMQRLELLDRLAEMVQEVADQMQAETAARMRLEEKVKECMSGVPSASHPERSQDLNNVDGVSESIRELFRQSQAASDERNTVKEFLKVLSAQVEDMRRSMANTSGLSTRKEEAAAVAEANGGDTVESDKGSLERDRADLQQIAVPWDNLAVHRKMEAEGKQSQSMMGYLQGLLK